MISKISLIKRLQALRRQAGITDDELAELIYNYSQGRTKSCAQDSVLWYQDGGGTSLIKFLEAKTPAPSAQPDLAQQAQDLKVWRSKCLAQASELGWLPKKDKGESTLPEEYKRFNEWIEKYGKYKKPFFRYTTAELKQLYAQLMNVERKDFHKELKDTLKDLNITRK